MKTFSIILASLTLMIVATVAPNSASANYGYNRATVILEEPMATTTEMIIMGEI